MGKLTDKGLQALIEKPNRYGDGEGLFFGLPSQSFRLALTAPFFKAHGRDHLPQICRRFAPCVGAL